MKKLFIAFIVLLSLFASSVSASVVINEYLPNVGSVDWDGDGTVSATNDEWVELYNNGTGAVEISNWTISDNVGVKHTIAQGTTLTPGEFVVYYGNFGLNNGGDTVYLNNSSGALMDNHTYTASNGDVSIGRQPDGVDNYVTYTYPTPGTNNSNTCTVPYDDLMVVRNMVLCAGTYNLNDASGDGLIQFKANNTQLDGNGATITGSGVGVYAEGLTGLTLSNINVQNYGTAVFFNGSGGNTVEDSTLNAATYDVRSDNSATANDLTNTTSTVTKQSVTNSQVNVNWYYDLYVNNSQGVDMSGADVALTSNLQSLSGSTNGQGNYGPVLVTAYMNNGSSAGNVNLNLEVNNTGYATHNSQFTISDNTHQDVTINDNVAPVLSNPSVTLNLYNWTQNNQPIDASVTVTDNPGVGIKNVTCRIEGHTSANVDVSGTTQNGNLYSCDGLIPSIEEDYTLTFTAEDNEGNINTTAGINFTTRETTSAQLVVDTVTIDNMTRLYPEVRSFNATLTSTGDGPLRDAVLFPSHNPTGFTIAPPSQACADTELQTGESCIVNFTVTVPAGSVSTQSIEWDADWTKNSGAADGVLLASMQDIVVSDHPMITAPDDLVFNNVDHSQNEVSVTPIYSDGNVELLGTTVSYSAGTFDSDWLNGFLTADLGNIAVGSSENFNFNFTVLGTVSPGTYTGTFNIATTGANKDMNLTVTVNQDSSFIASVDTNTIYSKSWTSGNFATLTINNTGNVDQDFTLTYPGASGILQNPPSSEIVNRQDVEQILYTHIGRPVGSYTVTLRATGNVSGTFQDNTVNLRVEDTAPNMMISSPAANAIVSGDSVLFEVQASDAPNPMDKVEFYIDGNKVNETAAPYVYFWNTTQENEGTHTLKAIAYDMAGNTNESEISVIVNNQGETPIVANALVDFSFPEDTVNDSINLTHVFFDNDGDDLTYTADLYNATNINVAINPTTGIVTITPAANWSGVETIRFNANDSTYITSDEVNVTIDQVNDAPTTPVLQDPNDGEVITTAGAAIQLEWTSQDPDIPYGDVVNYDIYLSDTTPPAYLDQTNETNYTINTSTLVNGTTYYWHVSADDGDVQTPNSTTWNFTYFADQGPVETYLDPTNGYQVDMAENGAYVFNVNATDPDGGITNPGWVDFSWELFNSTNDKIDGKDEIGNYSNYTFNPTFDDSGDYTLKLRVQDENYNELNFEWPIHVNNTNRLPVFTSAAITNRSIQETDTLTIDNIWANDDDLGEGDTLNYTLDIKSNLSGDPSHPEQSNNDLAEIYRPNASDYTNATFNLTHTLNWDVGNHTVNLTVTDDRGGSASQVFNIEITNVNELPQLDYVNVTAQEGVETLFSFDVIDGDEFAGVPVGQPGFNLTCQTDVFSTGLNITDFGTKICNFRFIGNHSHVGEHEFYMSISDGIGTGDTVNAKITITPIYTAPDILPISNTAGIENVPMAVVFTVNDTDLDDSKMTESLNFSSNVGSVSTLFVSGEQVIANFVWTPNSSQVGVFTVNITATDMGGLSDSESFDVTVANLNDPPTIQVASNSYTIEDNHELKFNVTAIDPDLPGFDTLIFDKNVIFGTLNKIADDTAEFTWTPEDIHVGLHYVNFTVTDNGSLSDSVVVEINVTDVNTPPTLNPVGNKATDEETLLVFDVTGNDTDFIHINNTENLTYSVNDTRFNVTQVDDFLATISFMPETDFVGVISLEITVTDSLGETASEVIDVTVNNVNDAPHFTSLFPDYSDVYLSNTSEFNFVVTAADVDQGDSIEYYWYKDTNLVTSGTNNYTLGWSNTGHEIKVVVNDSNDGSVSNTWTTHIITTPRVSTFNGATTNFNGLNLSAVQNPVFEKTAYGKIEILGTVDLTNSLDFDNCMRIEDGVVAVETQWCLPGLAGVPARISLYHLTYDVIPTIYFNNGFTTNSSLITTPCTTCTLESYTQPPTTDGTVVFNTTAGFSSYGVGGDANGAPVITSTPVTSATVGVTYTYDVEATDNENDAMEFSLDQKPTNMTIDNATGLITWTPTTAGDYPVSVKVEDNNTNVGHQDFTITVSTKSELEITEMVVIVDGEDDKIRTGQTNDEVKPLSVVEVEVEVKNTFSGSSDVEIENIEIEVTIEDIDEGRDLNEESDDFDLDAGDDDIETVSFIIPENVDEEKFKVVVEVKGTDETGQLHSASDYFYIEIDKPKHEVAIDEAELGLTTVDCNRNNIIDVRVINLGSSDEDDLRLEIESIALGIDIRDNFDLDEGTGRRNDDVEFERSYSFEVSDDVVPGDYPITVRVLRDGRLDDQATLTLTVGACQRAPLVQQEDVDPAGSITVVRRNMTPGGVQIAKSTTPVKEDFFDSSWYTVLLLCAFLILLAAVIFLIGAVIIKNGQNGRRLD